MPSYTPYETLFALQRSSPILWKKVKPTLAPEETKISFVLRAESEFPQHQQWSNGGRRSGRSGGGSGRNRTRGGGGGEDDDDDNNAQGQGQEREKTNNYGCFKCYQVLPPTQFEALRLPPRGPVRVPVDMRRFCIPCGAGSGIYQPREQIVPMKGPKVWVCDCSAIHEESTYHCPSCRTHCPFRR
ncbi:hypothetical protein SLS62_009545 [Diatrype stigma]|uniref:Uncharacterized protein n=1 Tax=Diatrype stigma TaxID=117547 RepID=A0AAN9UDE8_9PEZI